MRERKNPQQSVFHYRPNCFADGCDGKLTLGGWDDYGRSTKCKKCGEKFDIPWASPMPSDAHPRSPQ